MSFATSSLQKQMLTELISNLQFGLMAIVHKQQKLSMQSAQIAEDEARKMSLYWNNYVDCEYTVAEAMDLEFGAQFMELDRAAAEIHALEKQLDSQKIYMESRLKQAESMQESNDKLLQKATKEICISTGS